MSLCLLFLMNLPSAPAGSGGVASTAVAIQAKMTFITVTDRTSLVV